jgi:hypothetical protein
MAIGSKLRPNLKTRPDRRVFLCRKKWPQHGESWGHSFASNGDFAAGSRCLIPAAPAVPAAAAKQQNDKYDDEKRGGIHVELLLAMPCVFSHFAYALPLQPF